MLDCIEFIKNPDLLRSSFVISMLVIALDAPLETGSILCLQAIYRRRSMTHTLLLSSQQL